MIEFAPEEVLERGRLQPGRIFLVDTEVGRILPDEEVKGQITTQAPYGAWLEENRIDLSTLPESEGVTHEDHGTILARQQTFGYTQEDLRLLMTPMAVNGEEAMGSMGTDTPLASYHTARNHCTRTSSSCSHRSRIPRLTQSANRS